MNGKNFALLTVSLLALSLLLFGCVGQRGNQAPNAGVSAESGQIQNVDAQDLAYVDDVSSAGQDLSDLEVNESDWTS